MGLDSAHSRMGHDQRQASIMLFHRIPKTLGMNMRQVHETSGRIELPNEFTTPIRQPLVTTQDRRGHRRHSHRGTRQVDQRDPNDGFIRDGCHTVGCRFERMPPLNGDHGSNRSLFPRGYVFPIGANQHQFAPGAIENGPKTMQIPNERPPSASRRAKRIRRDGPHRPRQSALERPRHVHVAHKQPP